jgi:hypothetical protein
MAIGEMAHAPQQLLQRPSLEDRETYVIFRHQIVCEDNLVNHRISWLMLAQAFLFALLYGSLAHDVQNQIKDPLLFRKIICFAGLVSSLLVVIGIVATQSAIKGIVDRYNDIYRGYEKSLPLPPIDGGELPNFFGKFPLYGLPVFCVALWGFIWYCVR